MRSKCRRYSSRARREYPPGRGQRTLAPPPCRCALGARPPRLIGPCSGDAPGCPRFNPGLLDALGAEANVRLARGALHVDDLREDERERPILGVELHRPVAGGERTVELVRAGLRDLDVECPRPDDA